MRRVLVALVLLPCACLVDVSFDGSQFRCETSSVCPFGQTCFEGVCQTAPPIDAGLPDTPPDAAIDASVMTVTARPSASSDDSEERTDTGAIDLGSTDLELVNVTTSMGETFDQVIGIRFPDLAVPQGATILDATIQFTVDESTTVATLVEIRGEASDDANAFDTTALSISSRSTTTAAVSWDIPDWVAVGDAGDAQRTPPIAEVISEITSRPGWAAGNDLVIIISGNGKRTADAFDGPDGATNAPELTVTFTVP